MASQGPVKSSPDTKSQGSETPIEVEWGKIGDVNSERLTDLVRACLGSDLKVDEGRSVTWGQFLVEKLINKAATGDLRALQEIWTRVEGKPGVTKVSDDPPITIDDGLAQLILNYGQEGSENHRDG
jgi:hypothetical protein